MKKGKGNFFILFLLIVSATVLCGYFSTTILFQQSLNNIVGEYVSENNRQLANHISYRLNSGSEYISDFADTLSRMPEFLLTEDLLDRKADALELERIIVVNEDGTYLSNSEISEDCQTWIKENNHLWEGPVVSYIRDNHVAFSSLVIRDSQPNKVVIGFQSYQELQSLVNRDDFQEQGINILLDIDQHQPIIIEKGTANSMKKEKIVELVDDLVVSGYPNMKLIEDCCVVGDWIDGTRWLQITIIPTAIIMSTSQSFINIYFILMIAILLLFGFMLVHLKKEEEQRNRVYISDMLTGGLNREGFFAAE